MRTLLTSQTPAKVTRDFLGRDFLGLLREPRETAFLVLRGKNFRKRRLLGKIGADSAESGQHSVITVGQHSASIRKHSFKWLTF